MQYGKHTLSLPLGGVQNKYRACAGLTLDQPAKHIEDTAIIKGREFSFHLNDDAQSIEALGEPIPCRA